MKMEILHIKEGTLYKLLMMVAGRVHGKGSKAFRASSDEYEVLVTIKVKEKSSEGE